MNAEQLEFDFNRKPEKTNKINNVIEIPEASETELIENIQTILNDDDYCSQFTHHHNTLEGEISFDEYKEPSTRTIDFDAFIDLDDCAHDDLVTQFQEKSDGLAL